MNTRKASADACVKSPLASSLRERFTVSSSSPAGSRDLARLRVRADLCVSVFRNADRRLSVRPADNGELPSGRFPISIFSPDPVTISVVPAPGALAAFPPSG